MEPRIRYAKTEDGVSIAYAVIGEGEPLVFLWNPHANIRQQWDIAEFQGWYEKLAQGRMLVQLDYGGTGLSERDVSDTSMDTLELDITAVTEHLGLATFSMFGNASIGPAAIRYAAQHPEQVKRLILWHSIVRGSDLQSSSQAEALRKLMGNWDLYTDTLAHYGLGWAGGEAGKRFGATIRDGITQDTFRAYQAALMGVDMSDVLPRVQAPTLVLHRRDFKLISADAATRLAAGIPDARLVLLKGESGGYALEDSDAVLDAIDEFLREDEAAEPESLPAKDVHTILFTDMAASTALTQRLGDAKAQDVRRAHNTIVRDALKVHEGREVKHTGDGIMASFSTSSSALDCAIAIQQGVAAHKDKHPDSPLGVYIGLNAGEPIVEDDDLFGTSINLAARICGHAEAGQIVAADVVRQLAAGKQFLFSDLGETELRGFEDPVKLWELRWQEDE